ncbi:MAG TPA: FHA domain-containing protein [Vicinamibacteria bacterium]|jgi:DNA-binding winged helix-turn-helix (wHTH) protein
MKVRFGDCVFDSEMRQLRRASAAIDLPPKTLLLLEALLEQRPRPVSKQSLQDRLWPDTFVSESSLARLIAELRQALGDEGREPRLIRTVHRFGYAFAAEVESLAGPRAAASGASCWLVWRDREYPLAEGDNLLGRGEDCLLALPSGKVSRRHARIRVGRGDAVLEDLGSKNGTYVGAERIAGPTPLADGDEVRLGSVLLVFHARPALGSTETAAER